jgi:DNA repair protein RadC
MVMGAIDGRSGLVGPVRGPADVVRFVHCALGSWYASHAAVVVVGLDAASRVTGLAENRQRWTPRSLTVREMVDLSAELAARALVLVQLVPNMQRDPSTADAQSFRMLATKCASDGALVLDCIVVSGERWWSLGRLLSERAASN